jgi:flagellar motor switch protein FliN/FliY
VTEISPKAKEMLDWVFAEWSEKLAGILEQMADERPQISGPKSDQPAGDDENAAGPEEVAHGEGALIWEQSFALAEKPLVWVAVTREAMNQIGERTLRASGVETIDANDARNAFPEVLSQSLSALGQSISDYLARDGAATSGAPAEQLPADLHWLSATLEFADLKLEPIWIGCSQQILDLLVKGAEREPSASEESSSSQQAESRDGQGSQGSAAGQSKTFDLLLDVSLSVSVSFGRTFLPIREVLKLTTGSIVELDRAVNEPVEIIVNNCVIARGEVVVVEGNYGVRINQIASRHDRLRTGTTAVEAQHALSAR